MQNSLTPITLRHLSHNLSIRTFCQCLIPSVSSPRLLLTSICCCVEFAVCGLTLLLRCKSTGYGGNADVTRRNHWPLWDPRSSGKPVWDPIQAERSRNEYSQPQAKGNSHFRCEAKASDVILYSDSDVILYSDVILTSDRKYYDDLTSEYWLSIRKKNGKNSRRWRGRQWRWRRP